ncbi:hypothetical protein DAI22_01g394450 [Oryza sativa Japonica Group]|nr:hypothetical protein DAI22_01g394450 [Oryza sativa Japonica Group]
MNKPPSRSNRQQRLRWCAHTQIEHNKTSGKL